MRLTTARAPTAAAARWSHDRHPAPSPPQGWRRWHAKVGAGALVGPSPPPHSRPPPPSSPPRGHPLQRTPRQPPASGPARGKRAQRVSTCCPIPPLAAPTHLAVPPPGADGAVVGAGVQHRSRNVPVHAPYLRLVLAQLLWGAPLPAVAALREVHLPHAHAAVLARRCDQVRAPGSEGE